MISACADGRVSREGLDSRPLSENPCLCVAVPVLYDGGGSGWLLARGWCVWCAAVGRGRARPRGGGGATRRGRTDRRTALVAGCVENAEHRKTVNASEKRDRVETDRGKQKYRRQPRSPAH